MLYWLCPFAYVRSLAFTTSRLLVRRRPFSLLWPRLRWSQLADRVAYDSILAVALPELGKHAATCVGDGSAVAMDILRQILKLCEDGLVPSPSPNPDYPA